MLQYSSLTLLRRNLMEWDVTLGAYPSSQLLKRHRRRTFFPTNIPNTPMQHGYKTQHSTVTTLHTLNNTVAKGFNQMAHPARTITVALDMSKAFDTINIHTLIRKQTINLLYSMMTVTIYILIIVNLAYTPRI